MEQKIAAVTGHWWSGTDNNSGYYWNSNEIMDNYKQMHHLVPVQEMI